MKSVVVLVLFGVLYSACIRQVTYIPSLEDVLEENPRLQRVLDHCRDDSLKYEAAVFLIKNLPFHFTSDAPSMDAQLKLYEMHSTGRYYPEQVLDSVVRKYGRLDVSELKQTSDLFISPDYLIENIDWAFKVWREQPWGKNVPFETFLEYVLPYRVGDERLVSWRKEVYEKYNPLLDSIRKLPEAEDPFTLDRVTGAVRFLSPQKEMENVTVYHKFPLYLDGVSGRVVGGVFEGSNDRNFRSADTLFLIKERPVRLFTEMPVAGADAYRYVRYRGAEGSYCDIAEIAFYASSSGSLPLQGTVIGTSENALSGYECAKAFDGDPYTAFSCSKPDGGWTGLDLKKPHIIKKIVFAPRNRDDFVRKGDSYELFYCDGDWKSAGTMVAQSDSLAYRVPKGSLLYVKNHTRGHDERIFEYRDGGQIFW